MVLPDSRQGDSSLRLSGHAQLLKMSDKGLASNQTCVGSATSASNGGSLFKAIGILVTTYYVIRWAYQLAQAFRLYIYSQHYSETDYVKRYGKWAVVSGATDGIGLAMARQLAKRGHSIIVIGRNYSKLSATRDKLEKEKNVGDVVTIRIDLSEPSVENFEDIRHKLDPDNRDIGILINSAGISPEEMKRFHRFDMNYLANMVNVNLMATVYLTRMILPGMLERQKGLVMNISSSLSATPSPFACLYTPTKVFIDAFSRQLEIEYSSHPIDIICLNPGPVITNMLVKSGVQLIKPGLVQKLPDDFAKSAINAISTRATSISGVAMHGIARKSLYLVAELPAQLYAFGAKNFYKKLGINCNFSTDWVEPAKQQQQ